MFLLVSELPVYVCVNYIMVGIYESVYNYYLLSYIGDDPYQEKQNWILKQPVFLSWHYTKLSLSLSFSLKPNNKMYTRVYDALHLVYTHKNAYLLYFFLNSHHRNPSRLYVNYMLLPQYARYGVLWYRKNKIVCAVPRQYVLFVVINMIFFFSFLVSNCTSCAVSNNVRPQCCARVSDLSGVSKETETDCVPNRKKIWKK